MNIVDMIVVGTWGILFVCFVGVHRWKTAVFLLCSMALWCYLCRLSFDMGILHQCRVVRGVANRIAVNADLKESVVDSLFCNAKSEEADDLIMNTIIAMGWLDEGDVTRKAIDFLNEIASSAKEHGNRRKAAEVLLNMIQLRSDCK